MKEMTKSIILEAKQNKINDFSFPVIRAFIGHIVWVFNCVSGRSDS